VADNSEWPLKNAVTEPVTYEAMLADFEGPGVDDRFLRLLGKAKPIKWGLFHHSHTSTYYRDRVVLIGDSAHASLPFQAAGAAQGLEDALVLSNVLAELARLSEVDTSQVRAAFGGYDSVRRPRAQKQLERAAEVGRMLFFLHEEAGSDMDKILLQLQQGWFDWLWFHDVEGDVRTAMIRMQNSADR
jgi:salicylate hydroxylase